MIRFLFALSCVISLSGTAQITFQQGTLKEALDLAKKENKPLFVDVFATWCGPCKRMAATTFTDESVAKVYNTSFVSLQLDGEKNDGPEVMEMYGISAYPTLLYFSPDGKLIKKVVGMMEVEDALTNGNEILHPELSPLFEPTKKYHSSKKEKVDLTAFITVLKENDSDSAEFYSEKYYIEYPNLDLKNSIELEIFMDNEHDYLSKLSQEFLTKPVFASNEQVIEKVTMFIQQAFITATNLADFNYVETAVRYLFPYLQDAKAEGLPEMEDFIAYLKVEFAGE